MENKNYNKPEIKCKVVSIEDLIGVIQEVLSNGKTFCLTITGASMTPFLHHLRDQAIFAPLANHVIRKGDIVFYQRDNGQYVMHRVYYVDETGVMAIVGDAQWILESGIRPDQLRAYVIQVVRKGKMISCEHGFWRYVMTIYMDLRIQHPQFTQHCIHVIVCLKKILCDPACVKRYIERRMKR